MTSIDNSDLTVPARDVGDETGEPRRGRSVTFAALLAAVIALFSTVAVASVGEAAGKRNQRVAISAQGETGVAPKSSARLERRDESLGVKFRLRTPEPGSYEYPTADMIPAGDPVHPDVVPGKAEVFTLWVFIFNNPAECSDACNGDDLGDTPAQGGVYQADATIGYDDTIVMNGDVWATTTAYRGVPLVNPHGAEVHVAMAPHGGALAGADLTRQLNGAIGNPAFWWVAVFTA